MYKLKIFYLTLILCMCVGCNTNTEIPDDTHNEFPIVDLSKVVNVSVHNIFWGTIASSVYVEVFKNNYSDIVIFNCQNFGIISIPESSSLEVSYSYKDYRLYISAVDRPSGVIFGLEAYWPEIQDWENSYRDIYLDENGEEFGTFLEWLQLKTVAFKYNDYVTFLEGVYRNPELDTGMDFERAMHNMGEIWGFDITSSLQNPVIINYEFEENRRWMTLTFYYDNKEFQDFGIGLTLLNDESLQQSFTGEIVL